VAIEIANQSTWRTQVLIEGQDFGRWNRGEVSLGSTASTYDDPEDGTVPLGGRQTAEDVELTRGFKRSRDLGVYRQLKALRGRAEVTLIIHVLGDDGLPVESTPTDVLTGVLTEVKLPEQSRGGDDASEISITVQLKP
jgi:hypothetical protein